MPSQHPKNSLTMAQTFQKYFSVKLANTQELKQQVYNIRYHVYCKEFEFESIESCPNEMETDEYDDYSLHCLIIHNTTDIPAACVRLVPKINFEYETQGQFDLLPFEKFCADSLDKKIIPTIINNSRKIKCLKYFICQLASSCLNCVKKAERDSRLRSFFTSSVVSPTIGTESSSGFMSRRNRDGSCLMLSP